MQSVPIAIAPSRAQRPHRRWLLVLIIVATTLVLLATALVAVAQITSVRPIRLFGRAMEPTVPQGSYLLVQTGSYENHYPARGEIVLFKSPDDPTLSYVGRVIGLPGEHVRIHGGHVYINGTLLVEPYIVAAPAYTDDLCVDPGTLYVLGDNRNNSSDSHDWGLLPREHLLGHVIATYWPLPGKRFTTPTYPGLK